MKVKRLLATISLSMLVRSTFASEVEAVPLPSNVPHQAWETLLKKYVDDRGLVAYGDWKENQTDLSALDIYSDHGKDYSRKQMIWDSILNFLQFWK